MVTSQPSITNCPSTFFQMRMVFIYVQYLTDRIYFVHYVCLIQVAIAPGFHLFPFRTEKLSPVTPMVLRNSGRVGSCRFIESPFRVIGRDSLFCYVAFPSLPLPPSSLHYDNKYAGYADYTGNGCLPFPACPESIVFFRGYGKDSYFICKERLLWIYNTFVYSFLPDHSFHFSFLFLISLYPSYYDGYVVYNKRQRFILII